MKKAGPLGILPFSFTVLALPPPNSIRHTFLEQGWIDDGVELWRINRIFGGQHVTTKAYRT